MTFEARVAKGAIWKRLIDSVKDLVNEANFDCSPQGLSIQSMDSAHVALVSLGLNSQGFAAFSCHRPQTLGVNLTSLSKVLKVTENDDTITLRHDDDSDVLTIVAEAADGKKTSEYQIKLMEIEADAMGIPEQDHTAKLSLPSDEFAKIIRDMSIFGDTVTVDVTRERVKFSGAGDIGEGFALLKATDQKPTIGNSDNKSIKAEKKVKDEVKPETKTERTPIKAEDADADDAPLTEKFKKEIDAADTHSSEKSDGVYITTEEPIQLAFALRYLNTFAKGSALSDRVEICLAKESPCRVEYKVEGLGYLRWYLAPKVDGED